MNSNAKMDISCILPRSTKEARLLKILSYYRPIEILHSTVEEMCTSSVFKEHFQKILQHDLETIKRRSQDLDDHEISLAQRAFVILMDEGDHIAGIELYVEEIIGLQAVEDKNKLQIVKTSVKTKDVMMKKFHSGQGPEPESPPFRGSSSSMRARKQRQVSEELFVSEGSEHGNAEEQQHQSMDPGAIIDQSVTDVPGDQALNHSDEDPKFERLWKFYQTASSEYCKTRQNTISRTKAAKFLRDTTENCVLYIKDKRSASNSQMYEKTKLRELHNTLEEAIKEVEKGSGGKKRRFDDNWDDVPIAPRQLLGDHPAEFSKRSASNQDARKPPMKILPPPRGSYRYKGPNTAPISRYKEERLSQFDRQRLASLGQDARGPQMRTSPPPSHSYGQDRPMIASNNRYYKQYPSQFNRRRSASPGQTPPKPPRKGLQLQPPHDSYGGPKAASSSRYHEQRLSQINRRRSASPGRYPNAPRQVSMSEQSRDRRRQDLLSGYYDTYRPHY